MESNNNQRSGSGWRIAIVGTGGQGVLTAARLLCDCFMERSHQVVSGQLHGMSQRGGSVLSTVMIDAGISPVVATGRADCVLGFEPVETARALPLMSARTVVYMNTAPVIPYVLGQRFVLQEGQAEYPNVDQLCGSIREVTASVFPVDATRDATEAGSSRALNMVMLGCLIGGGLLPCPVDEFWNIIEGKMPRTLKEVNTRAFSRGVELARTLHLREANA